MSFWATQKIAVTGATGFLGGHTALALQRCGAEVVALVRPTSDLRRLLSARITCKVASLEDADALQHALHYCGTVVHVAAAVGFGNDWDPYRRINLEGTQRLLAAAQRAGVRRFVHTSSICTIAAAETPILFDETAAWNLHGLHVPYVTTKRRAEQAALAANGSGFEVIVVNPANIVGPDDFAGSEFGILCRRFWRGRIPFHFGGGSNFVDVRDVADGICRATEHGRAGQRYLLAGENRSYSAFFDDLARAAGRTIPRLRLPVALAPFFGFINDQWYRGRSKRPYLSASQAALMGLYFFVDNAKARRELGFEPRPLPQSLADAYAFWSTPRQAA